MDYEERHWILVGTSGNAATSEVPTQPSKQEASKIAGPPSKQQRYDKITFPQSLAETDVLRRFDFTETVIICAGEEQKEYIVHKNVLATSSSEFLNRMLSNGWRETREKRLSLPETLPDVLEIYLHWMYTGNVIFGLTPTFANSVRKVELYILGDYLDDMTFCETIVDGMVVPFGEPERELPNATAVRLAWSKTSVDSPLRAVIKELFMGAMIYSTVEVLLSGDEFPYEFVLDLLSGLLNYNKAFCEGSISQKSDALIRETCKGFVRGAGRKRL